MSGHRLPALAAAAALSLAALPAAAAGCCPEPYNNCPCAPTVPLEPYDITGGIYVVNQGPVFSGPGPVPRQWADPEPYGNPYVGFVFSGYPYGLQHSGGYARGFYSPNAGYPYAESYPYVGCAGPPSSPPPRPAAWCA